MTPERARQTNHWNALCNNPVCGHRKGGHKYFGGGEQYRAADRCMGACAVPGCGCAAYEPPVKMDTSNNSLTVK